MELPRATEGLSLTLNFDGKVLHKCCDFIEFVMAGSLLCGTANQFLVRHHDMLPKSRPYGQPVVIAPQGRMIRTLNRDVEIAIEHMAELNVGEREFVSGKIRVARELALGDVELLAEKAHGRADRGLVPILRRGPH